MHPEAINSYQEAIKFGSKLQAFVFFWARVTRETENANKRRPFFKHLETGKDYVSPGELAVLYVALDERDKAFALLEKA